MADAPRRSGWAIGITWAFLLGIVGTVVLLLMTQDHRCEDLRHASVEVTQNAHAMGVMIDQDDTDLSLEFWNEVRSNVEPASSSDGTIYGASDVSDYIHDAGARHGCWDE